MSEELPPEPRVAPTPREAVAEIPLTVRLVEPRVLRRVLKAERDPGGLGLHVPHDHCHTVPADVLRRHVADDELGGALPAGDELVLLAVAPDLDDADGDSAERLRLLWRRIFHAHLHALLAARFPRSDEGTARARETIDRIGQLPFDEVRAVLRSEDLLLPPADDIEELIELAATYLELICFDPDALPLYFPALAGRDDLPPLFGVETVAELARTRPSGAPGPRSPAPSPSAAEPAAPDATFDVDRAPQKAGALVRRARRAGARGDHVRAALASRRASRRVGPAERAEQLEAAGAQLDSLASRLARLAADPSAGEHHWRVALAPMLEHCGSGRLDASVRFLYDLQKACNAGEKEHQAIDLVEWALTLGRRPIRRRLPHHAEVRVLAHLRKAAKHLRAADLPERESAALRHLVRATSRSVGHRLRAALRPELAEALDGVGLTAENLPERVSAGKLTEELIDRVTDRGFFAIGELRDALSRNRLDLADLSGPRELFGGDALLRLDRRLAILLDGTYRRGEIYMRMLQRMASLAFGTRPGRFLVRFGVLPFGGAWIILEGLQHLAGAIVEPLTGVEPHLIGLAPTLALGVFLLGVLHAPAFRAMLAAVGRGFARVGAAIGGAIRAVVTSEPVQRLLRSGLVRVLGERVLGPALLAAPAALALSALGLDRRTALVGGGALFLLLALVFGTRPVRDLRELAADALVRGYRQLRLRLFPALIRFVLDIFRGLAELFERGIYAVDGWLRYRTGDHRLMLVAKPVLGLIWFVITYVVRIYVNLLIEPQINPIKHFPVVTVSHKIILPMSITLTELLAAPLAPLGPVAANTIAASTVLLLPGIFGFLVWELKEDWKLYAANRPDVLRPLVVGEHSETMSRFLRRGFHSGTLPKLYDRLRRAERRDRRRAIRAHRDGIEKVAHEVARFVARDLVALLDLCSAWGGPRARVGRVDPGSNRIRVELEAATGGPSASLAFEEQSGFLVAHIAEPGWVAELSSEDAALLRLALTGFYRLAGVDLVREQIESRLPEGSAYDVADAGLLVWPGGDYGRQVVYDLAGSGDLRATGAGGELPVIPAVDLRFSDTPLRWRDWVDAWHLADERGREATLRLTSHALLPRGTVGGLAVPRVPS